MNVREYMNLWEFDGETDLADFIERITQIGTDVFGECMDRLAGNSNSTDCDIVCNAFNLQRTEGF